MQIWAKSEKKNIYTIRESMYLRVSQVGRVARALGLLIRWYRVQLPAVGGGGDFCSGTTTPERPWWSTQLLKMRTREICDGKCGHLWINLLIRYSYIKLCCLLTKLRISDARELWFSPIHSFFFFSEFWEVWSELGKRMFNLTRAYLALGEITVIRHVLSSSFSFM